MSLPGSLLTKCRFGIPQVIFKNSKNLSIKNYSTEPSENEYGNKIKTEFRVLQLKPVKRTKKQNKGYQESDKFYREKKMSPDQDWCNVWPGPKSFCPGSVPLPIRQGFNKHGPPPTKIGNLELMKIPNFLHLTPPAIKKHCNAIKKFCTPWPKDLDTDDKIDEKFPIEIIYSDYCHSSPSIRDPRGRVITLRIKLKTLDFNLHAKDKFLRLVGERYDPKTDYVTIVTDSCPIKKQNYDYAYYLLTALYFESWKFENWEKEKSTEDQETYVFKFRRIQENVNELFNYNNREMKFVNEFATESDKWINEGDNPDQINNYKKAAMKMLLNSNK